MKRLSLIILCFTLVGVVSASAQGVQKIAAVVNDEVISVYDLEARLTLVINAADAPNTAEVRRRLAPQVLRRLIDDALQLQEAKRLDIQVTDADLERAFTSIEEQNNLPVGGLDRSLAQRGIDKVALINQLEPEIAWTKVVSRRLRPQIQVSREEIDEVLARIEASKGKPEYLLSEIFLRVDDLANEKEIAQLAQRILQQLKSGGNFAALARNFSQAASAAQGGDLGWVRADELGEELGAVVSKMQEGQVAGPVRTLAGYHIVGLRKSRIATGLTAPDITVELQQLFFPLADGADAAAVEETRARAAAAAEATTCVDMERLAGELGTPMSGSLGKMKLEALPVPLRDAVENLEIMRPSAPVHTSNGVVVLMVCDRQGIDSETAERERIERMLVMERLDIAARRYLRDLRRAAFIDIRL